MFDAAGPRQGCRCLTKTRTTAWRASAAASVRDHVDHPAPSRVRELVGELLGGLLPIQFVRGALDVAHESWIMVPAGLFSPFPVPLSYTPSMEPRTGNMDRCIKGLPADLPPIYSAKRSHAE